MGKVLTILVFLSSLSFAQLIGPKLAIQQQEFNFGDIKQGTIVAHEFAISNTGDDKLLIKDVRASCGCTAAKPAKDTLKPGESTTIKVQFNTAGREGAQQKYVYVSTNVKDKPEVRLKFTANIITDNKAEQNENGTSHN